MTLRQLAEKLSALADAGEELSEELAEKSLELIHQGFRDEVDPRGVAWAPRRGKQTWPILNETGALEHGFVIAGVNKNGFGIINDTSYGGYHQDGTRFLPKRRMVPGPGEGLERWAEPLQTVARAFIRKKLGK
jgi:phage gpG-like protein